MLNALVAVANRFEREGVLLPLATKPRRVNWQIEIDLSAHGHAKPMDRDKSIRAIRAPDVMRSGSKPVPLLLVDKARNALGIVRTGAKDKQTDAEAHEGFVNLIRAAHEATGDADLERVLLFLAQPLSEEMRKIKPDDWVTFIDGMNEHLCERKPIQQFWASWVANSLADAIGTCLVCGTEGPTVRIFPNSLSLFRENPQITSFEATSFRSFGKKQTANAPICFLCAAKSSVALEYLFTEKRHHTTLIRVEKNNKPDPMRSQLAVFWLKETVQQLGETSEIDLQAALAEPVQAAELTGAPPPELTQLQALLRIPWTVQQHATNLETNSFFLAVLSAYKTRLVVREWLEVPLTGLRDHLGAYVQATRICGPRGEEPRPFSIPSLLAAVNNTDPNAVRGLLRTAYQGVAPPDALLNAALSQFGKPKYLVATKEKEENFQSVHLIAALLKLLLTHGKGDAERMERLDMSRDIPAYLCGRILGIVEEMQRRSADTKLNRTLVERLYTIGTNSPATALAELTMLAETAYLPKLRKATNKGFGYLQGLLIDTMSLLNEKGGVPSTFTSAQRAEFALGLYAQRADFAKK